MCLPLSSHEMTPLTLHIGVRTYQYRKDLSSASEPRLIPLRCNAAEHVSPAAGAKLQLCSDATTHQSNLLSKWSRHTSRKVLLANVLLDFRTSALAVRQRHPLTFVIEAMPMMLTAREYKLGILHIECFEAVSVCTRCLCTASSPQVVFITTLKQHLWSHREVDVGRIMLLVIRAVESCLQFR